LIEPDQSPAFFVSTRNTEREASLRGFDRLFTRGNALVNRDFAPFPADSIDKQKTGTTRLTPGSGWQSRCF
jgi:hypothetical protein